MNIEDFSADVEMEWDSFNKHLANYDGESEEVVCLNWNSFRDVAYDFYVLGKQSKEHISEGLEEAAKKYAYKGIPEELKSEVKPIADEIIKNFMAGAEWGAKHLK